LLCQELTRIESPPDKRKCGKELKKINNVYIDLYYALEDRNTPLEETLGTFESRLGLNAKSGKVSL
jgi:hypothetical protein